MLPRTTSIVAALLIATGCSQTPSNAGGPGNGDPQTQAGTGATEPVELAGAPGSAGVPGTAGAAADPPPIVPPATTPPPIDVTPPAEPPAKADIEYCGEVALTGEQLVPAGKVASACAGTQFSAGPGAALVIEGQLFIRGTPEAKVGMHGPDATPGGWKGVVIKQGGSIQATHWTITGATLGIHAQVGSSYALDYLDIDKSMELMFIEADGSLNHGRLHARGADQPAFSLPVHINDAAPTIANTLIDNGNSFHDHFEVTGAKSSPKFDHVEIANCHCGVHTADGVGIQITNSNIHNTEYGVMALAARGTMVSGNVFEHNTWDVGLCLGGTMTLQGNTYGADGATFDPGCAMLDPNPADRPPTGVGPQGL